MWLSLRVAQTGEYSINPVLSTSTYDSIINSAVQSLAVSAAAQSNTNTNNTTSTTKVNAASKTTIGMQKTGLPLNYLILAILMVWLFSAKKKVISSIFLFLNCLLLMSLNLVIC